MTTFTMEVTDQKLLDALDFALSRYNAANPDAPIPDANTYLSYQGMTTLQSYADQMRRAQIEAQVEALLAAQDTPTPDPTPPTPSVPA